MPTYNSDFLQKLIDNCKASGEGMTKRIIVRDFLIDIKSKLQEAEISHAVFPVLSIYDSCAACEAMAKLFMFIKFEKEFENMKQSRNLNTDSIWRHEQYINAFIQTEINAEAGKPQQNRQELTLYQELFKLKGERNCVTHSNFPVMYNYPKIKKGKLSTHKENGILKLNNDKMTFADKEELDAIVNTPNNAANRLKQAYDYLYLVLKKCELIKNESIPEYKNPSRSYVITEELQQKYIELQLSVVNNRSDIFIGSGDDQENTYKAIWNGIQNYYAANAITYCNNSVCNDIIPRVADYARWLDELSTLALSDSMKKLWSRPQKSCLYVGKSGFGKTVGLFTLMQEIIKEHDDILAFYVNLAECREDADSPILQYIYKHYFANFHISISISELNSFLRLLPSEGNTTYPSVIFLVDDISSCSEAAVKNIQREINWLQTNRNVQMLLTSRTIYHPFVLGEIATQRFDFQNLTSEQIESYLKIQGINSCNAPMKLLSNPLILTLYARSNDFVEKSFGDTECYVLSNIDSEAEVLWNYLEMFAMNFYRKEQSKDEQLKYAFFFRFALPYVAFCMLRDKNMFLSPNAFSNLVNESCKILQDVHFTDVFHEYFGYEDDINFSRPLCIKLLKSILVNQTGFAKETRRGMFEFAKSELLHFLAATYVYRMLIFHDYSKDRPDELTEFIFTTDMCRYIGELCRESDNSQVKVSRNMISETLITKALDTFRREFSGKSMNAVSNIVQVLKISRNDDITGADLSYLDLRRSTFSNVICGHEDECCARTLFDGSLIDRWTFKTYGYCNDNASLNLLHDNSGSTVVLAGYDKKILILKGNKEAFASEYFVLDDYIQSVDISPDKSKILIAYMFAGIEERDSKTCSLIQKITIADDVMIGSAKYISDDTIALCNRDRKLIIYNTDSDSVQKVIPCNSNSFIVINQNTILAPSRERDIQRINIESGQIEEVYSAKNTDCGYITKAIISANEQSIYAATKDGALLSWNYSNNDPMRLDLPGDINDVLEFSESSIYCLSEQKGLIRVNPSKDSYEMIGTPFKGTWKGMLRTEDSIIVLSAEGSVFIYDCDTECNRGIIEEGAVDKENFIFAWNASFNKLHEDTTMDDSVKATLRRQNCMIS